MLTRFLLVCLGLAIAASTIAADDSPDPEPSGEEPIASSVIEQVTEAKIKEFQSKLALATDLDEETRTKVDSIIGQAQSELQRGGQLEASAKSDRDGAENIQDRVQTIKQELQAKAKPLLDELPKDPTLAQYEAALVQRSTHQQQVKAKLTTLQSELSRRSERRKQIVILQSALDEKQAEAERQLAANVPNGESSWITTARNLLQLAKLQALAYEAPAYQWELARYDAEQAVELPMLRIRQAQQELLRVESEIEQLNEKLDALRKKQARTKLESLVDFANSITDPEKRKLAQENADQAKENERIVAAIGQTSAQIESASDRLETLQQRDRRTRERVERVGHSGAIGLELRKQLSQLPDIREIRRQGVLRQNTMRDVELSRLSYEDQLLEIGREPIVEDVDPIATRIESDHADTLRSLSKNYDTYFQQLSELDFNENQLVDATVTYRDFLDQHVLWIRSEGFFGWNSFEQAIDTLRNFVSPSVWMVTLRSLRDDFVASPWLYAMALASLLLLLPARYRGRDQIVEFGKAAERPTCTEFRLTLRAAAMTAIMAIVWPAVLVFVGWRLTSSPSGASLANSMGRALIATGVVLALLNSVRQSNRPSGLALSHFGWSERVSDLLRRRVGRFRYAILPLVFIVVTMQEQDSLSANNSLLRLGFSIALLILAWWLFGLLHPRRGVLVEYFQRHSDSWVARFKNLWIWIVVGFPIGMAVLAMSGFTYTANELTWRFWNTLWIAVILIAFRAFAIRALQLSHRELRIQSAKERRANAVESTTEPVAASEAMTLESEHEMLRGKSEQALRILHSGLWIVGLLSMWFLWSGIFPAFRILDQWTLWETTRDVAVKVPLADGGFKLDNETVVDAITPNNVLAALFVAFATFTLVRNAPGLIEMTILKRLPMDASFKFAIAMMCRYVILTVGLLMMFSAIGASWSKLQWLVAALTVGLGFGLQEIFGNFVSGLIILWERPVRIGDVVTLDGVSGTVSRIQTRATTISDWDRKEYIVPNKDFVTGRLLNWTRSDQVSRIVIPVGIAYGSDVRLALKLLRKVAVEHPRILDDPPVVTTFDGFGDSTLNLNLRCFLPNLDHRLETQSELHLAIDDKFREAGIEIAFPQQDLHVRSLPKEWNDRLGDPAS